MNSATNSSIASARPRSELRTLPAHRAACPMHFCLPAKRAAGASRAATCPMHFCPPAKRVAESSRTPSNLPNAPLPARGATCDLPTLHSRRATCAMRRCLLLRTLTHISPHIPRHISPDMFRHMPRRKPPRMLACMLLAHAAALFAPHL